jgi:hypothetical protein
MGHDLPELPVPEARVQDLPLPEALP